MTNIEKALLSNVHPHIDINLLEEVIDATPNSCVATEILCGIYLEPEFPQMVYQDKDKTIIYQVESFDKWQNQVKYWYETPKCLGGGYFPRSIEKDAINENNYKELKVDSSTNDCRYVSVYSTTEMERKTSSIDLSRWMSFTPVDMFEYVMDNAPEIMDSSYQEAFLAK